jgi:lactose/L-arabinose transport system permease protein
MSSSYTPEYGVIMLAIVVATLPTIIIFFAFQKQFVQGMLGSVKQ